MIKTKMGFFLFIFFPQSLGSVRQMMPPARLTPAQLHSCQWGSLLGAGDKLRAAFERWRCKPFIGTFVPVEVCIQKALLFVFNVPQLRQSAVNVFCLHAVDHLPAFKVAEIIFFKASNRWRRRRALTLRWKTLLAALLLFLLLLILCRFCPSSSCGGGDAAFLPLSSHSNTVSRRSNMTHAACRPLKRLSALTGLQWTLRSIVTQIYACAEFSTLEIWIKLLRQREIEL